MKARIVPGKRGTSKRGWPAPDCVRRRVKSIAVRASIKALERLSRDTHVQNDQEEEPDARPISPSRPIPPSRPVPGPGIERHRTVSVRRPQRGSPVAHEQVLEGVPRTRRQLRRQRVRSSRVRARWIDRRAPGVKDHVVHAGLPKTVHCGVILAQPRDEHLRGVVHRHEHLPQRAFESGTRDGDEPRVVSPFDQVPRRHRRRVSPPVGHKRRRSHNLSRLVGGSFSSPPPVAREALGDVIDQFGVVARECSTGARP